MKKNKKNQSVGFTVIEVDENTSEPKIVELSEREYDERISGDSPVREHAFPFRTKTKKAWASKS